LQGNRVCNRCGKELDMWDLQQDFTIHTKVGYGSIHDMDTVHYQLCCDCFDKAVEESRVSPIIEEGC